MIMTKDQIRKFETGLVQLQDACNVAKKENWSVAELIWFIETWIKDMKKEPDDYRGMR